MGGLTPTTQSLQETAEALKKNQIVLFPCDTIWGLIAVGTPQNSQRLFEIKNRPNTQPFITLVKDRAMAGTLATIQPHHHQFLSQKWPGPTTFVFKNKDADSTIAIRVPSAPWLQDLLALVNAPIISTSANLSGQPSPQTLADIPSDITDTVDLFYTGHVQLLGRASQLWDMTQTPPKRLR